VSGRRIWRYVADYWHWPVLAGVLVYAYFQFLPPIDVSNPGRPAPEVEARTLDGDVFRLSDYRGNVVVVNVWATWCPPCRVEMPGFVRLQRDLGDRGVQFVGIAVDQTGPSAVREFVNQEEVNFPQVVSPQLAARHFPGEVVPRTYLIDREGRIRYEHSGLLLAPALRDAIEDLL
jgi:peroxiredoxin